MKVLTIHSDVQRGGAAFVARQLHQAFNAQNLDIHSHFVSPNKALLPDKDSSHIGVNRFRFLMNVLLYRLGYGEGALNSSLWENFLKKNGKNYDLIHLHNAHGYYLPNSILEEIADRPMLWTLHDLWLFTGRCAVPLSCKGYIKHCDPCPHRRHYPAVWFKNSNNMYSEKMRLLSRRNIKFIVPSNFMRDQVLQMGLNRDQVQVIYNPLDFRMNQDFRLTRKQTRKNLKLNEDEYLGIFISNKIDNPDKGLWLLLSVLNDLQEIPNWRFLFIGNSSAKTRSLIQNTLREKAILIDFINDRSLYYSYLTASNVLVNPTLSESFGFLNIEAALVGCHVVATNLPVIKEMIGDLGIYFEKNNKQELFDILKNLFKLKSDKIDSHKTRDELIEKFSITKSMNEYRECYKKLLV